MVALLPPVPQILPPLRTGSGSRAQSVLALQDATPQGPKTAISTADALQFRLSRPSGWHHPCSSPARGGAAAEPTMNRKQRQLVSIWVCAACEACNSASAELCLSCGTARQRRELLGLLR